ncbi:MAG TPA: LytTR family DNA-binding domain-containing protein [Bacteroidia bacterium]
MIKAIAIDDEPLALRIIQSLCNVSDDVQLVSTFTATNSALTFLKDNEIDLMFVDIQMPGINGMEWVKSLENRPMVVFTSAFAEYAVDGFNVDAVDYLLKPISQERFLQALLKVKNFMKASEQNANENEVFVKSGHNRVRIEINQITYIEGYDDYLKIHRNNLGPVVVRMTMKKMLELLPDGKFIRIHKSFIVPLDQLDKISTHYVQVKGKDIPIGKTYKEQIKGIF